MNRSSLIKSNEYLTIECHSLVDPGQIAGNLGVDTGMSDLGATNAEADDSDHGHSTVRRIDVVQRTSRIALI